MKCPNCGTEMKEGMLYCEKCGEDIHIVPDFEPELEQNIVQNLEPAIEEAAGESDRKKQADKAAEQAEKNAKRHTSLMWIGWIGLALLVIVFAVAGAAVMVYYSSSMQIRLAEQAVQKEHYEKAVAYYQRAMELEPADIDLLFSLADVYYRMNDKEQYAAILQEIIDNPYADEAQLESAYGKLIAVYRAQGDYQSINDMLLACSSDSVRAVYQSYIPQPPEFSVPAGVYDAVKALKLTADGDGTIYYTTDGSDPDTGSAVYDRPILLEDGSYRIRAVYVDENGVSSEIVEADYIVSVQEPTAPEVTPDSGEYNLPVQIEVTGDTSYVYYTTDGTIPTATSTHYTGPIYMKPGKNVYHFVRISNGVSSSVEERVYTLELFTDITPERACQAVMAYQYDAGKVLDTLGHYNETGAYYLYECQYVVHIGETDAGSDYYVIAETLIDMAGNRTETGNSYAVEAYTGNCYGLQTDGNGNFTLTELPAVTSEES